VKVVTESAKSTNHPSAPTLVGSMTVDEIRANAAEHVRRNPAPPLSDAVIVKLRALFDA
jgi:hypothetical protein